MAFCSWIFGIQKLILFPFGRILLAWFLSCSTRMVSSVGRGQIIKEALLRTFFFLLKNAVTRRCFHKSSQLHFTAEWASLQSASVPGRAKILNHWISQLPSFVLALLHMKHTEKRRESLWALFLKSMQDNVESAKNMAWAVYVSCQQHMVPLCQRVWSAAPKWSQIRSCSYR